MTPEELQAMIEEEMASFNEAKAEADGAEPSPKEGKEKGSTIRSAIMEMLPLDPTRAIVQASQGIDDLAPTWLGGSPDGEPTARTRTLAGIRKGLTVGASDEIDAAISTLGGTGEETFGETVQVESDATDKLTSGLAGGLGELLGSIGSGFGLAKAGIKGAEKVLGSDIVRKGFSTAWGKFVGAAAGSSAESTLNSALEGGLYQGVVEKKWGPLIKAAGLGAAGGAGAQLILGEALPRVLRSFNTDGTNRAIMVDAASEIVEHLKGQGIEINPALMDPDDLAVRAQNLVPNAKMLDVYPELDGLIRARTGRLTPREQLQPLVNHVLKRAQFAEETFTQQVDALIGRPDIRSKATVERDTMQQLTDLQPEYDNAFDDMLKEGIYYESEDVSGAISDTFRLVDSITGLEKNVLTPNSERAFLDLNEYVAELSAKSNGVLTPRQLNGVKHYIDSMLTSKSIDKPTSNRPATVLERDTARLLVDARVKIKTMLHAAAPDTLKQYDKTYGDALAVNRAYNAGLQVLKDRTKAVDDYEIFMSDPTTTPAEGMALMEGLKKSIADLADTSTSPAAIRRKITENPEVMRKVSALLGPEKAQGLIASAEQYALSAAQAKRAIAAMPVADASGKGFLANVTDAALMGGAVTGATGVSLGAGAGVRALKRGEMPMEAGRAAALNTLMMNPGGAPSTTAVLNELMKEGMNPANKAQVAASSALGSQAGGIGQ